MNILHRLAHALASRGQHHAEAIAQAAYAGVTIPADVLAAHVSAEERRK